MSQLPPGGPTGPTSPTGPFGPGVDPATGQPLPAPLPRKRSWFARHKVLTALGGLVVVFVVVAVANQGGGAPAGTTAADQQPAGAASHPAVAGKPSAAQQQPTKQRPTKQAPAGVGTPVRDGKFEFTVTKVETGVKRVGNDLLGQDAQGQFVLVHLTVKNIGTEAQYFDGSSQKLHDSSGRTFSADDGAAVYLDQSNSFLNQINPGNTVQGIVLFDVPADAHLVSAELHDSMFSGGVSVALG